MGPQGFVGNPQCLAMAWQALPRRHHTVQPPPCRAAPRSTLNVSSQAILVLKPRLPDQRRPYTGRKNNPGLKCVKIGNVEVSIFSSLTSDSSNVVRGAALTAGNHRGYSQTDSMSGYLFKCELAPLALLRIQNFFCFVKLCCLLAFWFVCQNFGLFAKILVSYLKFTTLSTRN